MDSEAGRAQHVVNHVNHQADADTTHNAGKINNDEENHDELGNNNRHHHEQHHHHHDHAHEEAHQGEEIIVHRSQEQNDRATAEIEPELINESDRQHTIEEGGGAVPSSDHVVDTSHCRNTVVDAEEAPAEDHSPLSPSENQFDDDLVVVPSPTGKDKEQLEEDRTVAESSVEIQHQNLLTRSTLREVDEKEEEEEGRALQKVGREHREEADVESTDEHSEPTIRQKPRGSASSTSAEVRKTSLTDPADLELDPSLNNVDPISDTDPDFKVTTAHNKDEMIRDESDANDNDNDSRVQHYERRMTGSEAEDQRMGLMEMRHEMMMKELQHLAPEHRQHPEHVRDEEEEVEKPELGDDRKVETSNEAADDDIHEADRDMDKFHHEAVDHDIDDHDIREADREMEKFHHETADQVIRDADREMEKFHHDADADHHIREADREMEMFHHETADQAIGEADREIEKFHHEAADHDIRETDSEMEKFHHESADQDIHESNCEAEKLHEAEDREIDEADRKVEEEFHETDDHEFLEDHHKSQHPMKEEEEFRKTDGHQDSSPTHQQHHESDKVILDEYREKSRRSTTTDGAIRSGSSSAAAEHRRRSSGYIQDEEFSAKDVVASEERRESVERIPSGILEENEFPAGPNKRYSVDSAHRVTKRDSSSSNVKIDSRHGSVDIGQVRKGSDLSQKSQPHQPTFADRRKSSSANSSRRESASLDKHRSSTLAEVPALTHTKMAEEAAQDEAEKSLEAELFTIFQLFDYDGNGTIDVKDLGTVIRCFRLNPSQADVERLTEEVPREENDPLEIVHFNRTLIVLFEKTENKITWSKFYPKMVQIIEEGRYAPASEDELISAFSALDVEKKGYLTVDQLRNFVLTLGEPLNEDEFDQMMALGTKNAQNGHFDYAEYAKHVVSY